MYFKDFNDIYYTFIINGKLVVKSVKDITTNVRFRKQVLSQITLYDEYDMIDGDTPEIIAAKYYGSSEYHWVVMLANNRFSNINDFPVNNNVFESYVNDKYGSSLYSTHHYEDLNGYHVSVGTPDCYPVSNYEYEMRVNEKKRRIKLISPKLLATILQNYKSVL